MSTQDTGLKTKLKFGTTKTRIRSTTSTPSSNIYIFYTLTITDNATFSVVTKK